MKIELKSFGFAPGSYMCKCITCNCYFEGDKRSVVCEKCAKKRAVEYIDEVLYNKD